MFNLSSLRHRCPSRDQHHFHPFPVRSCLMYYTWLHSFVDWLIVLHPSVRTPLISHAHETLLWLQHVQNSLPSLFSLRRLQGLEHLMVYTTSLQLGGCYNLPFVDFYLPIFSHVHSRYKISENQLVQPKLLKSIFIKISK